MIRKYPSFIHHLVFASFTPAMRASEPVITLIDVAGADRSLCFIVESGPPGARKQQICVEGWYTNAHDEILTDIPTDVPLNARVGHIEKSTDRWTACYVARNGADIAIWRAEERIGAPVPRIVRLLSLDSGEPRFIAGFARGLEMIYAGTRPVSIVGECIGDVTFIGDTPRYRVRVNGHNHWYRGTDLDPKGSPYLVGRSANA